MGKSVSISFMSFVFVLIGSLFFFLPIGAETEYEYENDAFKIHSILIDGPVIHIEGEASVFEGTIQYTVTEDGEEIKEGFTTASAGGPEWGDFEITIDTSNDAEKSRELLVTIYEESAKDGSRTHVIEIPVTIEHADDEKEGDALPATATTHPMNIMIGLLIAIGAATVLTVRRRVTS